jgi:hypothetical protein
MLGRATTQSYLPSLNLQESVIYIYRLSTHECKAMWFEATLIDAVTQSATLRDRPVIKLNKPTSRAYHATLLQMGATERR